jgi:hypothetical protein
MSEISGGSRERYGAVIVDIRRTNDVGIDVGTMRSAHRIAGECHKYA